MKHRYTQLFPTLILILLGFATGIVRHQVYNKKFDKLCLGTDVEEIKKDWGEPDADLSTPGDSVFIVRYGKGVEIWGKFIFKFDHNNKLIFKYLDN